MEAPTQETWYDKLDRLKAEIFGRMRLIGWGMLLLLVVLLLYGNSRPETLDLIFYAPNAPGFILYFGVFLAGLLLGKVFRLLSAKARQVEARYRQKLEEEAKSPAAKPG